MKHEATYSLRPREMRREHREGRKPAPGVRNAGSRRGGTTARDGSPARGPNHKLLRRGLNGDTSGPSLSRQVAIACAPLDRSSHEAMRRLVHALDAVNSALVLSRPALAALARISTYHDRWMRTPRTWRQSASDDLRTMVDSLARHLLCAYRTPLYLGEAWLHDSALHVSARDWFVRLGTGRSLRGAPGFPFAVTRAMLHHFTLAPENFELRRALRFAQYRGLGVRHDISMIGALSAAGDSNTREALCLELGKFFARHPDIPVIEVRPIIDFALANPGIRLAERSLQSVNRLVTAWHARLHRAEAGFPDQEISWEARGIAGFSISTTSKDETVTDWQVMELLSSAELHAEGHAMHHCVRSYMTSAASGRCAIFSMRSRLAGTTGEFARRVTIEVDPLLREVVQARGHCNATPGAEELAVLYEWSRAARLSVRDARLL